MSLPDYYAGAAVGAGSGAFAGLYAYGSGIDPAGPFVAIVCGFLAAVYAAFSWGGRR